MNWLGGQTVSITFVNFVVFSCCTIAAFTDIRRRLIYNWTTYPAFLLVLTALLLCTGIEIFSPESVVWTDRICSISWFSALSGLFVGILLTGIPYTLGQGGAGDVKLAAVIGLGLGFEAGLTALLIAYIIAFAWGMVLVLYGKCRHLAKPDVERKYHPIAIPMGAFFLCGVLYVFIFC